MADLRPSNKPPQAMNQLVGNRTLDFLENDRICPSWIVAIEVLKRIRRNEKRNGRALYLDSSSLNIPHTSQGLNAR
jgi:hypothetical protein